MLDYWNTSVRDFANREFVVDDKGCRYTYKELDEQSSILAGYLVKIGIRPNDVVSYQMPVWSEFVLICPTWFRNKNYEKNILSIKDKVKSLAHIILVDSMREKSETLLMLG